MRESTENALLLPEVTEETCYLNEKLTALTR